MRNSVYLMILGLLSFKVAAQSLHPTPPHHPQIAVVLAGGGAKGAAHIGVLKALEDLHVPIDFITGTSMGAFFGGLYATGMSADEIEALIYSVDWNSGYRDRVSRSDRRIRDKEYEDRYQLTTDLGVRWGEIRAYRGLVQGQGMLRILRETSGNLPAFESFDELAIPYRSVATDIVKLEPVILDKGNLADAMMASMSVPGALPPYNLNGRLLVDGGVINNMPVNIAREIGAEVVIAVDISTDYKTEDDFKTFFTVGEQLSNYLVRRSTKEQADTLSDTDFLIRPEVGDMETTEFQKMPEAYVKGYGAVMALKDELEKIALSPGDYQRYIEHKQRVRRQLHYGSNTRIDKLVINNRTHYSDLILENKLNLEPGNTYKSEDIEQRIQDLYALDRFELINYRYSQDDAQQTTLTVDVNEKSWGPNYLNFRFFLEDDFETESQYSLGASFNFTDLNQHGAELRTNVEMGTDKLLEAELYSPFFSHQEVFTTFSVGYADEQRSAPVAGFENTDLSTTTNYLPVNYRQFEFETTIGYQAWLWRELKLGINFTKGSGNYSTLPSYGEIDFRSLGAFINYRIDSLDNYSLPTRGVYLDLKYRVSHDNIKDHQSQIDLESGDDTSHEFQAKFMWAYTEERHTAVVNTDFEWVENKNSTMPINPKEVGGFLNLSGIPRNSLIGQNKAYASLVYRYRWFDNNFGLFTSPFYLGASMEYGGVWTDDSLNYKELPLYVAGSVFAGVDSPLGPIMLAYGQTEQGYNSVYLILGTTFK
ncbi:patatin-like phospholipase family protein [Vibrio sp. AK197]